MPEGVKDLTKGKLESLLHIVDLVRGLDSRMEAQSLAVFLYVARRTGGNDFGNTGVTMDDIAIDLGIAQASVSRNVMKLSDTLINNPKDVLDRAAARRRPPSKRALKARFGLGLLSTEDDPMERRRKIVFLTPKGARVADKLMDYVISSMPISMAERRRRVSDKRYIERAESDYRINEMQQRQAAQNLKKLQELEAQFKKQLDSIKDELEKRKAEEFVPYSELLKQEERRRSSAKKKK